MTRGENSGRQGGWPTALFLRYQIPTGLLAAFVVLMVGMMIIPLPTVVLDVLLTANIGLGVLVLLVALHTTTGLELSAFPTILLLTTLYRIALNVSSTRLILLQADAGQVIDAFGSFVVQGNYVVGAIIFFILTLVQFVVIAKGSERVAEVGARFSLDAMPGKQMSIDAELRSGAIDRNEAVRLRRRLERESSFYGAMDGAMKFVKGDAIAGIVITMVNIAGGIAIGTSTGMDVSEALETYGLLTIGDGLVSQIPALLLSTGAGLVVTRVAAEKSGGSLGSELWSQVFGRPSVLMVAGVFLVVLALVPGLPLGPFLLFGVVLIALAVFMHRKAPPPEVEAHAYVPDREAFTIELSANVIDEVGGAAAVHAQIDRLRDRLFADRGLLLPRARIRERRELARSYRILLREREVGGGSIPPNSVLVEHDDESPIPDMGHAPLGTHPLGSWLSAKAISELEQRDLVFVEPAAGLVRHAEWAVHRNAGALVDLQSVSGLVDRFAEVAPAAVRGTVPGQIELPTLTRVLRRLASEGVNLRDFGPILEAVAARGSDDIRDLAEAARAELGPRLLPVAAAGGVFEAHHLDPLIEQTILDSIQKSKTGSRLALDPALKRDVTRAIREAAPTRLITNPKIRPFVWDLVSETLPNCQVFSYPELGNLEIESLGTISP